MNDEITARAIGLLERLAAFDTESDKSNLPLIDFVGDGGGAEHHAGDEVRDRQPQRDQHHQQRDRRDAREREQVGQVGRHWPRLDLSLACGRGEFGEIGGKALSL